ncbi:MAG: nucleoside 2-deoxyribosyltransferase [Spirochaetes bacterium]|nr:nucleoside 2-deoxyribosyltransferase [Spirochaetota bacterium]
MKIYFAGSIRGGREDAALYEELIRYLGTFGHVLTEHIGTSISHGHSETGLDDRSIHNRDLRWLEAADFVIAEVSTPSLGVGYEIACAVHLKKRVLCLYRPGTGKRLSAMIAGCDEVTNTEYDSLQEAKALIKRFIDTATASPPGDEKR